jgi:hypothetical protein
MEKQIAIRGAIYGSAFIVLAMILFFIDPVMLTGGWYGLAIVLLYLAVMVVAAVQIRSMNPVDFKVGKAFKLIFIFGVSMAVVTSVFDVVFYSAISEETHDLLLNESIESQLEMMENFGTPQSVIDEQMPKIVEDMESRLSLSGVLPALLWKIVINAVLAIIIALIVQRRDKKNSALDAG